MRQILAGVGAAAALWLGAVGLYVYAPKALDALFPSYEYEPLFTQDDQLFDERTWCLLMVNSEFKPGGRLENASSAEVDAAFNACPPE